MSQDLKEIASFLDEIVAAGELSLLVESLAFSVLFSGAVLAVFFLLRAIGLYRINRRLGKPGAALAFIPGLSGYALGSAADALQLGKQTNLCIHMLMVELFSLIANGVYYYKTFGRFLLLYESLRVGGAGDTLALLEQTMTVDVSDPVFMIAYYATNVLNYAVIFVSFLCYRRILRLHRAGGAFILLMISMFVPQVMSVYLFASRNRAIYRKPVFAFESFHENPPFRPEEYENFDGQDGANPGDESDLGNSSEPYSDETDETPPENGDGEEQTSRSEDSDDN